MDLDNIVDTINTDPGLSSEQKDELTSKRGKKVLVEVLSGVGGAAIMEAIAKYKKMGGLAQAILATLGFGAGILLYKAYEHNNFADYDEESRSYKIDTKRF